MENNILERKKSTRRLCFSRRPPRMGKNKIWSCRIISARKKIIRIRKMVGMTVSQPTTLLNNGIQMPLLGLGVYDMHGKETEHAISEALKTGYRLIDTASMYGNEAEVGNAVSQ